MGFPSPPIGISILFGAKYCYYAGVALVRVLVDGFSLLHRWPELAEGAPRHSEAARDALVDLLAHYQDASGTPVTVFFDGSRARRGRPRSEPGGSVEVIFSSGGQTADDLIERAAHRFQDYGEVLVVTDDFAERNIVGGFGGSVASCANFIGMVRDALGNLSENLNRHNLSEQKRYYQSKLNPS